MKNILYYTGIQRELSILIPKQRGKGFIKSPFGGHHTNKKYHAFTSGCDEKFTTLSDIDGYVSIDFNYFRPKEAVKQSIENIMNALLNVFTYCDGFQQTDEETFFNEIS